MTEKKSKNGLVMAIIAVVFLALLGGLLYVSPVGKKLENAASAPVTEEQAATIPGQQPAATTPEAASTTPAATTPAVAIDVQAALSDRILGDTSAPLKISEHASLTCSHCGDFHKNTFDQVKTNYIDTGKAYLIFSDFPLNEPALKASMVARCLPKEKFFDFIHMLYTRQDEWAYSPDYVNWLKARAQESGMDNATFDSCINNKELEDGITSRMQAVQEQWHINATPSFVLNNSTVLAGAYPYDSFKKSLDDELAKASKDDGAGASEEPPQAADKPADTSATPDETPAAPDAAPVPVPATSTQH